MSLSSWNYGTFSNLNPYYIRINSGNENKRKNNVISEKKDKIVKQEFFENKEYETYINRDIELKNKFRLEQEQKRFKDLKQLKKFGKTFQVWEKLKNKSIRLEKREKEKKLEKEEEGNIVKKNITFNQWKRKLIKKIKKEEEKRLKSEETKKILSERRNKIRRENMKIWKIKKRESIKKEKEDELKKKKDKQLEEEKNDIERKEKNKIE
jgi:hypothetical protein